MGDIDDDNNAGALPQDYMYVGILMESQVGVPAPACLAAAGYEETKGFSASLITALVQAGCSGWRRAHALTQEFGTVSPILVIKATARENAAWVNGATPVEATDAAQNVRTVALRSSVRLCL